MNEYTFERINHTFDTNEMDLVLVTVHKVFSFTHSSSTMDSRYKRYITITNKKQYIINSAQIH